MSDPFFTSFSLPLCNCSLLWPLESMICVIATELESFLSGYFLRWDAYVNITWQRSNLCGITLLNSLCVKSRLIYLHMWCSSCRVKSEVISSELPERRSLGNIACSAANPTKPSVCCSFMLMSWKLHSLIHTQHSWEIKMEVYNVVEVTLQRRRRKVVY